MDNELISALTLACQATILSPWIALAVATVLMGGVAAIASWWAAR